MKRFGVSRAASVQAAAAGVRGVVDRAAEAPPRTVVGASREPGRIAGMEPWPGRCSGRLRGRVRGTRDVTRGARVFACRGGRGTGTRDRSRAMRRARHDVFHRQDPVTLGKG